MPEEHTKTTGKKTPLYFIAFALVMIMTVGCIFWKSPIYLARMVGTHAEHSRLAHAFFLGRICTNEAVQVQSMHLPVPLLYLIMKVLNYFTFPISFWFCVCNQNWFLLHCITITTLTPMNCKVECSTIHNDAMIQ